MRNELNCRKQQVQIWELSRDENAQVSMEAGRRTQPELKTAYFSWTQTEPKPSRFSANELVSSPNHNF